MAFEDMERQALNVFRMRLLGAKSGRSHRAARLSRTHERGYPRLVTNVRDTHYIIGSVVGPHPYPMLVRDFQSVIGQEARRQVLEKEDRLPDYVIACVGGGSNAMASSTRSPGTRIEADRSRGCRPRG